ITSPAQDAAVSGPVAITVAAHDDAAITGVQYFLGGATLDAEVTAEPYSLTWNTALATNGAHTLTARVRDAAGNTGAAAPVAVLVDNEPPAVAITSPADQSTVHGTVVATVAASDNL